MNIDEAIKLCEELIDGEVDYDRTTQYLAEVEQTEIILALLRFVKEWDAYDGHPNNYDGLLALEQARRAVDEALG